MFVAHHPPARQRGVGFVSYPCRGHGVTADRGAEILWPEPEQQISRSAHAHQ